MKPKIFYLADNGEVSKHKIRNAKIVGHGILHQEQTIRAYTSLGRTLDAKYQDVKVGTHLAKPIFPLTEGEKIAKIDILSDNRSEETKLAAKYGMYI